MFDKQHKQIPPKTIEALLESTQKIAGLSIQQLAQSTSVKAPENLLHDKGWIGQLLEYHLGASAASRPEPDFTYLGIELKTIPVNHKGKPQESTFVCVIPLLDIHKEAWETSHVKRKLQHVLWVPIESDKTIPLGERRIGNAILWQPSVLQESALKKDWEELTEQICLGRFEKISSRQGKYLQIRPKGANSRSLTSAYGPLGEKILTLPRGFYLRTVFTAEILQQNYLI